MPVGWNVDRGVILMGPWTVDLGRVVDGDIQHRWLGRLDDVRPVANDLDLRGRAETIRTEGAIAQELDPRHRLHLAKAAPSASVQSRWSVSIEIICGKATRDLTLGSQGSGCKADANASSFRVELLGS
jgi:hypothetical protein